jgi:DNA-binding NtrC family response regulator
MVVLVDNNELFRSALAANLRDDGYQVVEFDDGGTVPIDRLADIEALLSEYVMPGDNGVTLARRFHLRHPSVPVILITRAADAVGKAIAQLSYVTVLPKPLDYETLVSVLQWRVKSKTPRRH